MSSESEDEFQSADEGSDTEELEHNPKTSVHPQALSVNASPREKAQETDEYEAQGEELKRKLNKDTSNAEAALNTNKNSTGISKETVTLRESEISHHVDELRISQAKSVSMSVSCIENERIEERDINQHEFKICSESSITQEVCEESLCMKESQKESIKPEKRKGEFLAKEHVHDVKTGDSQSKEVIESLEDKSEITKCKSEISSLMVSSENTKTENTSADTEVLASNSKPKPIRQSKIGMKKPREKLGERIGAKKLGAKVAGKPIDSVSSLDIMKHKKEEDESLLTNEKGNQMIAKDMEDNAGVEDEKIKKRQQWEEQQERWHQALNLDKDRKEASSGDGDGWSAPWGGWGDTLLSAATTFTREVGRGVGTVMETVETSIGVPSPEVMAQELCKQEHHDKIPEESTTSQCVKEKHDTEIDKQAGSEEGSVGGDGPGQQAGTSYGLGGFSLGSLVSGVSGALETASSKVLMGGLDTLEVIGRKAMDVIQEGDPGLHKKRAFLSNKKPNLSLVLQEARQRAMEEEKEGVVFGGSNKNLQKSSFEQAWEATEGPVHLEALSLVAKQCQGKKASMIVTVPHYAQDKLISENAIIKTACELDESAQVEEDLAEVVSRVIVQMGLPLQPQKLIEAWSSVQEKATLFQEAGSKETDEVESMLYSAMAQLVAQFCALGHKGGELALITQETDPLDLASHFKELAQAVSCSLENTADQVCGTITSEESVADTQVSSTITNIYLQAASGNNYIQQSLVLLASVLQYSNTKSTAAHH